MHFPGVFFMSILISVIGGLIAFFSIGGVPWLGLWFMLVVPLLSYVIKTRQEKNEEETSKVG